MDLKSFVSLVFAIDYIEKNLREGINVKDVAENAYVSLSHLQSMFARTFHLSIGEYLAKRRLCLAAYDLIATSERISFY